MKIGEALQTLSNSIRKCGFTPDIEIRLPRSQHQSVFEAWKNEIGGTVGMCLPRWRTKFYLYGIKFTATEEEPKMQSLFHWGLFEI